MVTYTKRIGSEMRIRPSQVEAAVELLDSGNTVPFIARYRKEATESLDEEQLRQIMERVTRLRAMDERRETILASIEEQGQLTARTTQADCTGADPHGPGRSLLALQAEAAHTRQRGP